MWRLLLLAVRDSVIIQASAGTYSIKIKDDSTWIIQFCQITTSTHDILKRTPSTQPDQSHYTHFTA